MSEGETVTVGGQQAALRRRRVPGWVIVTAVVLAVLVGLTVGAAAALLALFGDPKTESLEACARSLGLELPVADARLVDTAVASYTWQIGASTCTARADAHGWDVFGYSLQHGG